MYPETYVVRSIENDQAFMTRDYNDTYGVHMPVDSVDHFEADLNGRVPPSVKSANLTRVDPAVRAVIEGRGEILGKGDDGVVWRVGDVVVKASTTVPYQPSNPGHRTPTEAMQMMEAQWRIGQKLRARGVSHLPPSRLVKVADKLFEIKPFYRLLATLDKSQLDQVTETIGKIHDEGYILGDSIQVGVDSSGYIWFYDIGKVRKGIARSNDIYDDFKTEVADLQRLYQRYGVSFEPPPGRILNEAWKDILHRHPFYVYEPHYLDRLRRLANAAIRAGVPNAQRDFESMHQYITDALSGKMEKRKKK
jgi:hypothetical protein